MTSNELHLRILYYFCIKDSNYTNLNPSHTYNKFIKTHYNEICNMLSYLDEYAYDLYNKLVEQDQDSQYALVLQNKVVSRLMCVLDTLRDTARQRINNKDLFKYR